MPPPAESSAFGNTLPPAAGIPVMPAEDPNNNMPPPADKVQDEVVNPQLNNTVDTVDDF